MARSSMGNKAADKACKCESKDKSNWNIIEAHMNSKNKVIATCSCKDCGNWWETSASYIKEINGSDKYKTLFKREKEEEIKYIENRLNTIENEISNLTMEKLKLGNRLNTLADMF